MKKELMLCLLAFTMIAMSCQGTNSNQKNEDLATDSTAPQTYVYRGVLPTKYDLGVATMTLHMVEGSGEGHFVYKIDYGNNVVGEGHKVAAYVDSGAFSTENSPELGDIYVLKGQSATYNFQPMDNKLNGLDSSKTAETYEVLTGIDPQDSSQSTKQVLATYKKGANNGEEQIAWSAVKNRIIAYKDADIKMQPISEETKDSSAYIVFNKEQSLAELFLPSATKGVVLKRTGAEGNYIWTDGHYELFPWKGYVLRYKNGPNLFGGDIE